MSGSTTGPNAEQLLRTLFESAPHALAAFDREGRYVLWNRFVERFSGIPGSARIGRSVRDVPPPFEGIDYPALVERALAGEHVFIGGAATHYVETGARAWWDVWLDPVHDAAGTVVGVLAIGHDNSTAHVAADALAQKERELQHAMKMEIVGRIAGGVAHDFNNILTAILSFARFAADELAPEHPVREDMNQVIQAADRAAQLTRQLLLFARGERGEPEPPSPVDVCKVAINVQKMLARVLGEDITLSLVTQPDLPPVLTTASSLEEVLMNLVINARDAMPRGGTLTLRVAQEKGNIVLSVADSGVGIPEELRARIFEPFFTTKEPGKGTGLGLSLVRDIVTAAGGSVEVHSVVGAGTTFRIELPAMSPEDAARLPDATPAGHDLHLGAGRVALVVEDEQIVRGVAARTLRHAGFHVVEASDCESALAAIQREPRVDFLLSDIVLPGAPGTELAREARTKFPHVRVLFMSGYPRDRLTELGVGEATVLPKPFAVSELLAGVELALA